MKRLIIVLAMALCALPLAFSQAGGQAGRNTRYVAVQSTPVKDSTGFFAKDVGQLALGAEVTVVREDGKWAEVRAGSLAGWVASASLSARRVVAANTNVTASEVAMAGKGFSPATEIEYKKSGLDFSAVDAMERITIPSSDLLQFIREGRLAGGE